ncbi:GTP 3',8-cyclase MoaA [Prosthecochloris sp.]|uniref:GTP 3',8-cyclase MoaA n=1 Tax=Prosthecochloris sp. TaxID=290513 RepID=UPI0025D6D90D|nr:GTP 3',8-cyclase MoaA [Prosthecochloris sp.]
MNDAREKMPMLVDRYNRGVRYVRVSVTSRCNLRCVYCMREEHCGQNVAAEELDYQEICRIIEALAALGVRKVRFTGGEPLLRDDIVDLVRYAKAVDGIETVVLTTNGVLLGHYLDRLLEAGLDGINFSLDTFDEDRYKAITRRNLLPDVLGNFESLLRHADELQVKINVLLLRGINAGELGRFADLTRQWPVTVRFMELMPFDDHQIWRTGKFMGADKILEMLGNIYPDLESTQGYATEHFSFSLPGYRGSIAIIPAFTRNFCSQCNRLRITSSGRIMSCLYAKNGVDMLAALRSGADNEQLGALFQEAIDMKPKDGRTAGGKAPRTSMSEIGG